MPAPVDPLQFREAEDLLAVMANTLREVQKLTEGATTERAKAVYAAAERGLDAAGKYMERRMARLT